MAQKITISVPDELYEKMQAWKSSLNFSRVFHNAVSKIIQKKENLTSKIRNEIEFSSIVDRLKKEKVDYELNIAEWGKRTASNGAKPPITVKFNMPSPGPLAKIPTRMKS